MRKKEKIWGWVFVLPLTLGILFFVVVPFLFSLYVAFSEYDLINKPIFTGLENIERLISDQYFWKSLGKTTTEEGATVRLALKKQTCKMLLFKPLPSL